MNPLELKDKYGEGTGWTYSSGKLHCAWDLLTPTGTPLHAGVHGTVRDVSDGVANNRPGHNPGSGSPSNWVLVWTTFEGRPATVYYQHLSPGVLVRPGQTVEPGTLLGHTGNSGNSSGPHLHLSTQQGHVQPWDRYRDLDSGGATTIWQPDRVFLEHQEEGDDMTPEQAEILGNVLFAVDQIRGTDIPELRDRMGDVQNKINLVPHLAEQGQNMGWATQEQLAKAVSDLIVMVNDMESRILNAIDRARLGDVDLAE